MLPLAQGAGWVLGQVWKGVENVCTMIQSPDCPAHSELLYELRYPSTFIYVLVSLHYLE